MERGAASRRRCRRAGDRLARIGAHGLVALCLLAPAPLWAQLGQRPEVVAEQRAWLLGQVRIGEATGREDLVEDALGRLRLLAPEDPGTLLASIRAALRGGQREEAQRLLERMRRLAHAAAELARAERLLDLSDDAHQAQLQQARLLALAGNDRKALDIYQRLFGDQPPDLALGIEYWRLRATLPGQRRAAIVRLWELERLYPGNAVLRRHLLGLLLAEGRSREADALLQKMAADPSTREIAAQAEMDHLQDAPIGEASVRRWQRFVERYPQSPLRAEALRTLERQRRIVSDPAWRIGQRGLALLERGDPAGAEAALRQALSRQPQEARWLGNLGLALLRQGRREEALDHFRRAQRAESDSRLVSKWHDLAASTRYWMLLAQAEGHLAEGRADAARAVYLQARRQRPGDPNALIGLADVALAEADDAQAERLLQEAARLAPGDGGVVRRRVALYARRDPDALERYVAGLSPALRQTHAQAVRDARRERLERQAEAAAAAGDRAQALALMEQAAALAPEDPWLAFRLAGALRDAGRAEEGDRIFARLLDRVPQDPAARYAHALYLSSIDRDPAALEALDRVPADRWNEDMRMLAERLRKRALLQRAERLREEGREEEAVALLDGHGHDRDVRLRLADWAVQRGDLGDARSRYAQALEQDPDDPDARLGLIETQVEQGDLAGAAESLRTRPPAFADASVNAQRRLANAWAAVGERRRAIAMLQALEARLGDAPDALLRRDLARLLAGEYPDRSLDLYALAMRDDGLLPADRALPRDDRALTRASREDDADGWLRRSLRADVERLYRRRSTVLTLYDHGSWRDDGTPGLSRLRRNTRIAHLDLPWRHGQGFAHLEQVSLDAGRFAGAGADAAGRTLVAEDLGGCRLSVRDAAGDPLALPACTASGRQRDSGVGAAVGWRRDDGDLAIDLGRSPAGFLLGTWYGGVATGGDLGPLGWSLTASRRPMTNSLLSYAGRLDPLTGLRWGGVTANGATLGLSYDQGGRNGMWSTLGWHRLFGENVADNDRMRLMAGWYHRLIRRADLRLDVGASAMYWRHRRDLGGYSLGQGGYYSPQRYVSFGLPVGLAWRNADWSVRLDGSLGWSRASSGDSLRYPLPGLFERLLAGLPQAADGPLSVDPQIQHIAGGSSRGSGYRVHAAVERRLSDHLVLGLATTLQRSRDYSPNNAQIYLRYAFAPWQGDLPLPPAPPEPYGEWR